MHTNQYTPPTKLTRNRYSGGIPPPFASSGCRLTATNSAIMVATPSRYPIQIIGRAGIAVGERVDSGFSLSAGFILGRSVERCERNVAMAGASNRPDTSQENKKKKKKKQQ